MGKSVVRALVGGLACLVLVAFSSAVRVRAALDDENFAAGPAEGLLKSDPALLVYLTARVAGAEGLLPADFHADPRIQYPRTTDVPAEFTVGQELLVGWLYRWLAPETPLFVFTLVVMSITASAALVGAFLLARALTDSTAWGVLAAALWACLPADYRTLGFVIVREDLSFPLFALHLGLLASAVRSGRRTTALASGLFLAGALATWHAAGFVLALELVVLFAWFLRSGENPLERAQAWLVAVPPLAAALCVPVLRGQGVLFSPTTGLFWALALAALPIARSGPLVPRGARPRARVLVALALVAALLWLSSRGAEAGYAHVYEVLLAKLRHLGRFPWEDPASLSFDARLLWQGPFATLPVSWFVGLQPWTIAAGLAALPLAGAGWVRRTSRGDQAVLALGLVVACGAAWTFERLQILPGLLLPVAAAVLLARIPWSGWARVRVLAAALLLVLQASDFAAFVRRHVNQWYVPAVRQAEIAELVRWARAELGPDEPVLGDFVNSTALLVQVGTPIVLHPKYETAESRRRAEAFLTTFFHGTTDELRALARERFGVRTVLIDRYTLWELSRTTAGLPLSTPAPLPGTAAEALLSQDPATLASVPGFTLLYRSPEHLRGEDGEPSDYFRVFRVD